MKNLHVIRHDFDDALNTHCYLLGDDIDLYFIHSFMVINDMTKDEFDLLLKNHPDDVQLLYTEDLEELNTAYHVDFKGYKEVVEQLKTLDNQEFINLFFTYYVGNTDEFSYNYYDTYNSLCVIYQMMFGCTLQDKILNGNGIRKEELLDRFIHCDDGDYDSYLFSNVYENEISDIKTYSSKKSFRDILFNSSCHGAITDEFMFQSIPRSVFSKKITLFYKHNKYRNEVSLNKMVKVAERKFKIDILLNPHYHFKEFKKSVSK